MSVGRPRKTMLQLRNELDHFTLKSETGCHLWVGGKNKGYGLIGFHGKQWRVHRLVFKLYNYSIPSWDQSGLQINHTCDNKLCINPEHLYCGTQQQNMLDRDSRGRRFAGKLSGEIPGRSKLTNIKVTQLRKLAAEGYSQYKLAKMFNVSPSTAWRAKNGESWKHLSLVPRSNPVSQHVSVEHETGQRRNCCPS